MDVEATEARISRLESEIRSKRIFIFGGVVVAASPFLPLIQGYGDRSLAWGDFFLGAVGVFVLVYGYLTSKKLSAERDELQAKLVAHQEKSAPKPKPVRAATPDPVLPEADLGEDKCVLLTVTGRVTGVGYRFWFSRLAGKLGLTGWVENVSENQVRALVCGPSAYVDIIAEDAAVGPRRAEPLSVEVEAAESPDLTDFQVRR